MWCFIVACCKPIQGNDPGQDKQNQPTFPGKLYMWTLPLILFFSTRIRELESEKLLLHCFLTCFIYRLDWLVSSTVHLAFFSSAKGEHSIYSLFNKLLHRCTFHVTSLRPQELQNHCGNSMQYFQYSFKKEINHTLLKLSAWSVNLKTGQNGSRNCWFT